MNTRVRLWDDAPLSIEEIRVFSFIQTFIEQRGKFNLQMNTSQALKILNVSLYTYII